MTTKQLIKAEIDQIQDEYLEILHKIIKAFQSPADTETTDRNVKTDIKQEEELDWHNFIEETYGCLEGDRIERGTQGKYEIREEIG